MSSGKTILIISGGIEAADAARRAKELGHTVVVSDRDPQAPGFALADSCLIADVYGASETAAAAERYSRKNPQDRWRHLRRRRCAGDGRDRGPAPAPARPADPCGGTGLRQAGDEKMLPVRRGGVPWFAEVNTPQELQRIAVSRGRDLVIKPVDSRGSRGVQRVAQVEDLTKAFMLARSHSPTERVMVEQYLSGPQVSTESAVMGGRCFTPGFRTAITNIWSAMRPSSSRMAATCPAICRRTFRKKCAILSPVPPPPWASPDGTVKGDIVVHDGEPYMIELAARLSGGFFCTREIPLNTGVDFIGAAIRIALGETVTPEELTPRQANPVIQRYAFPKAGTVTAVSGAEAARAVPGIAEVVVTARPGDIIPQAGDKRPSAAMVLATGATREAALSAANDALALIRIETA